MNTFLYDGTFNGLLSAIFDSYERRTEPHKFVPESDYVETLFDQAIHCDFSKEKAERVKKGLIKKTSKKGWRLSYLAFLSEEKDIEMRIFRFIQSAMRSRENIESNFLDDTILHLHQLKKKIGREVHRMHAFVRFQLTKDDIYYSVIEPDFNVMPLIGEHFLKRYPAQQWLIYDAKRQYGLFYDLQKMEYVTFADKNPMEMKQLSPSILEEEEMDYQRAWKKYFDSVNIPERRNMKLHVQHVPKRYWKYLSEKNLLLN